MTHCLVQQGAKKINSRWQREISAQKFVSYYGSMKDFKNVTLNRVRFLSYLDFPVCVSLICVQQSKHFCGGGIWFACDISIFGEDRFIINRWAIFIACIHVAQILLLLFTYYAHAKINTRSWPSVSLNLSGRDGGGYINTCNIHL